MAIPRCLGSTMLTKTQPNSPVSISPEDPAVLSNLLCCVRQHAVCLAGAVECNIRHNRQIPTLLNRFRYCVYKMGRSKNTKSTKPRSAPRVPLADISGNPRTTRSLDDTATPLVKRIRIILRVNPPKAAWGLIPAMWWASTLRIRPS